MSWQQERLELLRLICPEIAARRANGVSVDLLCATMALRHHGHTYSDGRPAKLSPSTIKRIYYQWDATGRPDGALKLFYKGSPLKDSDLGQMFEDFCEERKDLLSFEMAYREFNKEWQQLRGADIPVTLSSLSRRLKGGARILREEFARRRKEAKRSRMPQDGLGAVHTRSGGEKPVLNAVSTQSEAVRAIAAPVKGGV